MRPSLITLAHAEALLWVATELDKQVEALQQDEMRMLTSLGHRARVTALSETAAMCRAAARDGIPKRRSTP